MFKSTVVKENPIDARFAFYSHTHPKPWRNIGNTILKLVWTKLLSGYKTFFQIGFRLSFFQHIINEVELSNKKQNWRRNKEMKIVTTKANLLFLYLPWLQKWIPITMSKCRIGKKNQFLSFNIFFYRNTAFMELSKSMMKKGLHERWYEFQKNEEIFLWILFFFLCGIGNHQYL